MSTMQSENVAEKNKTNTRIEHINMILYKANEISHDLYNFKMKSREIQIKLQNDINTFQFYADLHSLEKLKIEKEDSVEKFLNSLNDLKLELKEAATVIAQVSKLSILDTSLTNTPDLNKRQTCNNKLQVLTNTLFCKFVNVKWVYALLKTQLSIEKTKRETIASLLVKYLPKETLFQPASALRHKHGSLSRQTLSLSDAISEMNKMIGKPSFPFSDEVPVSKHQISSEKQQSISEPGSTNLNSETKPLVTGRPSNPNASLFANQTATNNFSSSYVPGPTKASEPLGSFKFEPPVSIPSQFKTESIDNETSKLQANGPRPNINETPTLSGTSCVKFFPLIEVVEVDEGGVTGLVAYFNRCITMMKEYENKSLEELRLEDYFIFGVFKHQLLFGSSYGNLFTKDFKALDAIHVKFHPTNDIEATFEKNEKEADKFQCITLMNEFKNQSFEELRLGDYIIARVFPPETFCANGMGTAHVRFMPPIDTEVTIKDGTVKNLNVIYQYITSIKEFENKSLEELRLEDYIADRRGPSPDVLKFKKPISKLQNSAADGMGTAHVKFIPPTATEVIVKAGTAYNITVRYQYITSIKEFENKSLEELRLEDYIAGRRHHTPNVSKSQQHNSNLQNSEPASSTNKTQSPGNSKNTPSQPRETPTTTPTTLQTRDFEAPTQKKEATKQDHTTSRTPTTTPTPSQPRDFEAPTQKKEATKQDKHHTTSRQYWETLSTLKLSVSDEAATALEQLFEDGKTEKAIEMCNDALELDPENVFFLVHRARAHYELKQYREALEDSQKAVSLSPNLPAIGYLSVARCCLALGQVAPGEQAVRRAVERESSVEVEELREAFTSLRSKQETVHRYISQHKYYDAVYVIDHCLKRHCPASSMMKLLKAECLAHMRKYDEARSIVIDLSLLSTNAQSRDAVYADAMYVTGLCAYFQENDELATKHFRKVLENDPDHEKAINMFKLTKTRMNTKLIKQKKELGNKAFNAGDLKKAMDFYDEALSIDKNNKEENAKLHYNRATVFAKLDQPKNAIHACTAALELDGNYIKALLRRAQSYKDIEMYEESLDDYEKLYYIDSTKENELLMEEADNALKANRGPNYYYKVLGISMYAIQNDIKKAYRKCAVRYHPDKHVTASLSELRKNERKFKLVKEAYDVLSDPVSRANYDFNQNQWHKK